MFPMLSGCVDCFQLVVFCYEEEIVEIMIQEFSIWVFWIQVV